MKMLIDFASYLDSVDPTIFRQLIRSLMYLVNTGKDISSVVSTLTQFMVEMGHVQWVVEKHVLRYLCGTTRYGLRYVLGGEVSLQ